MINTLNSMGQSVQSLGSKALAHPHWAGKTGFAALTVTLVVLCGIAAVFGAVLYLLMMLLKGSNAIPVAIKPTEDDSLQFSSYDSRYGTDSTFFNDDEY